MFWFLLGALAIGPKDNEELMRGVCKDQESLSLLIQGPIETVPTRWHLKNLAALGMKATFMVTPSLVTPCVTRLLKAVHAENHAVGLFLSNRDLFQSLEMLKDALVAGSQWVNSIIGVWPKMISVPMEFQNADMEAMITSMGFFLIPATADVQRNCNEVPFDYNHFLNRIANENMVPSWYSISYSLPCTNEPIYQSGRAFGSRFKIMIPSDCVDFPRYNDAGPV